ncbi:MAG: hypothetical protein J4G03_05530 [Gemmatimonadetes bacterium]|nr:hypothetical protein [Gemmatimonadota bacterium]
MQKVTKRLFSLMGAAAVLAACDTIEVTQPGEREVEVVVQTDTTIIVLPPPQVDTTIIVIPPPIIDTTIVIVEPPPTVAASITITALRHYAGPNAGETVDPTNVSGNIEVVLTLDEGNSGVAATGWSLTMNGNDLGCNDLSADPGEGDVLGAAREASCLLDTDKVTGACSAGGIMGIYFPNGTHTLGAVLRLDDDTSVEAPNSTDIMLNNQNYLASFQTTPGAGATNADGETYFGGPSENTTFSACAVQFGGPAPSSIMLAIEQDETVTVAVAAAGGLNATVDPDESSGMGSATFTLVGVMDPNGNDLDYDISEEPYTAMWDFVGPSLTGEAAIKLMRDGEMFDIAIGDYFGAGAGDFALEGDFTDDGAGVADGTSAVFNAMTCDGATSMEGVSSPSDFDDGCYTVNLMGIADALGNTSDLDGGAQTAEFNVDKTGPTVMVVDPAENPVLNSNPDYDYTHTLALTASDDGAGLDAVTFMLNSEAGDPADLTVDGGNVSLILGGDEGENMVEVMATDKAVPTGNIGSASFDYTFDGSAPTISDAEIDNNPSNGVRTPSGNSVSVAFSGAVADPNLASAVLGWTIDPFDDDEDKPTCKTPGKVGEFAGSMDLAISVEEAGLEADLPDNVNLQRPQDDSEAQLKYCFYIIAEDGAGMLDGSAAPNTTAEYIDNTEVDWSGGTLTIEFELNQSADEVTGNLTIEATIDGSAAAPDFGEFDFTLDGATLSSDECGSSSASAWIEKRTCVLNTAAYEAVDGQVFAGLYENGEHEIGGTAKVDGQEVDATPVTVTFGNPNVVELNDPEGTSVDVEGVMWYGAATIEAKTITYSGAVPNLTLTSDQAGVVITEMSTGMWSVSGSTEDTVAAYEGAVNIELAAADEEGTALEDYSVMNTLNFDFMAPTEPEGTSAIGLPDPDPDVFLPLPLWLSSGNNGGPFIVIRPYTDNGSGVAGLTFAYGDGCGLVTDPAEWVPVGVVTPENPIPEGGVDPSGLDTENCYQMAVLATDMVGNSTMYNYHTGGFGVDLTAPVLTVDSTQATDLTGANALNPHLASLQFELTLTDPELTTNEAGAGFGASPATTSLIGGSVDELPTTFADSTVTVDALSDSTSTGMRTATVMAYDEAGNASNPVAITYEWGAGIVTVELDQVYDTATHSHTVTAMVTDGDVVGSAQLVSGTWFIDGQSVEGCGFGQNATAWTTTSSCRFDLSAVFDSIAGEGLPVALIPSDANAGALATQVGWHMCDGSQTLSPIYAAGDRTISATFTLSNGRVVTAEETAAFPLPANNSFVWAHNGGDGLVLPADSVPWYTGAVKFGLCPVAYDSEAENFSLTGFDLAGGSLPTTVDTNTTTVDADSAVILGIEGTGKIQINYTTPSGALDSVDGGVMVAPADTAIVGWDYSAPRGDSQWIPAVDTDGDDVVDMALVALASDDALLWFAGTERGRMGALDVARLGTRADRSLDTTVVTPIFEDSTGVTIEMTAWSSDYDSTLGACPDPASDPSPYASLGTIINLRELLTEVGVGTKCFALQTKAADGIGNETTPTWAGSDELTSVGAVRIRVDVNQPVWDDNPARIDADTTSTDTTGYVWPGTPVIDMSDTLLELSHSEYNEPYLMFWESNDHEAGLGDDFTPGVDMEVGYYAADGAATVADSGTWTDGEIADNFQIAGDSTVRLAHFNFNPLYIGTGTVDSTGVSTPAGVDSGVDTVANAAGQQTIWMRAADLAGNWSDTVSVSYILDAGPPIVADVTTTPTPSDTVFILDGRNRFTVDLGGTVSDPNLSEVRLYLLEFDGTDDTLTIDCAEAPSHANNVDYTGWPVDEADGDGSIYGGSWAYNVSHTVDDDGVAVLPEQVSIIKPAGFPSVEGRMGYCFFVLADDGATALPEFKPINRGGQGGLTEMFWIDWVP